MIRFLLIALILATAPCFGTAAEWFFWSDRFPPAEGQYASVPEAEVGFEASGTRIRNLILRDFSTNYALPSTGTTDLLSVSAQAELQWSTDDGATYSERTAEANVQFRINQTNSAATTRFFDAEWVALTIEGGDLPADVRLRLSPAQTSLGVTTVRSASGGYRIASVFDVFTELTEDGGQAWSPATNVFGLELSPTAAPPFIAFGAEWKYLDDGSDQSVAWQWLDFPDSHWSTGPAQLGYGDEDESTVINGGPSTNRITTYYFRHKFVVEDRSAFTNLLVWLIRDDGAVVHLNGTNVFRSNMPTGAINHTTFALAVVSGASESTHFHGKTIDPTLLRDGTNIVAVEVHQANRTSTDVSFDLALIGNFIPQAPRVTITAPTNGSRLSALDVTLTANATDPDGAVTNVAFYEGNTWLGEVLSPPFTFPWSNVPPGDYTLTAVALDDHQMAGTSAPVSITVVAPPPVSSGAVWKYLADGSAPDPLWMSPEFDDSSWTNGRAQLGFGDGDEATLIGYRTNGFTAFYFRHEFSVPASELASYTNLVLRLLRDDGGIVYLNRVEVFRSNMPYGPVDHLTLASTVAENLRSDANTYYATPIALERIQAGRNVVAAEIHQANSTSSDLSFDLELLANVRPVAPGVQITDPGSNSTSTAPATVTVSADAADFDGAIAAVEFHVGGVKVGEDTDEAFSRVISHLVTGLYQLRAVAIDQSGLRATSAPVALTVVSEPASISLIATGAVWRYLDDGSDLGTNWVQTDFDDRGWSNGLAKFGAVDAHVTTIQVGPSDGITNITTYFRTDFDITDADSFTNLTFRVLRDDGVVVHLNGAEMFRMNMPDGPVTHVTSALSPVGRPLDESTYFVTNVSASALREGVNALAAELHQYASPMVPIPWDAGFDLGLVGDVPAPVGPGNPVLFIERTDAGIVISWMPEGFVLQEADSPAGPYRDVVPRTTNSPVYLPSVSNTKFYGLKRGL